MGRGYEILERDSGHTIYAHADRQVLAVMWGPSAGDDWYVKARTADQATAIPDKATALDELHRVAADVLLALQLIATEDAPAPTTPEEAL
jgi:hypothetical protein